MKVREEKLRTIIEWSEKNEDVRVLLLTSSLVNPLALVDEFSDLDIEFVFEDNTNYISDKSWTLKFGNPIAMSKTKWAGLMEDTPPIMKANNESLDGPMFGVFRTPQANTLILTLFWDYPFLQKQLKNYKT